MDHPDQATISPKGQLISFFAHFDVCTAVALHVFCNSVRVESISRNGFVVCMRLTGIGRLSSHRLTAIGVLISHRLTGTGVLSSTRLTGTDLSPKPIPRNTSDWPRRFLVDFQEWICCVHAIDKNGSVEFTPIDSNRCPDFTPIDRNRCAEFNPIHRNGSVPKTNS